MPSIRSISDLTDSTAYSHNPEGVLSLRLDLVRLLDDLKRYPGPLVLAAVGWIPPKAAIAEAGIREQTAWKLLKQIRDEAQSFLGDYGRGRGASRIPGSDSEGIGLL